MRETETETEIEKFSHTENLAVSRTGLCEYGTRQQVGIQRRRRRRSVNVSVYTWATSPWVVVA